MSKRKPWVDVMPPNEDIWLMFDEANPNPKSRNYLWWFDTLGQAVGFKRHHNKLGYPGILSTPVQYLRGARKGRKSVWLLFDLSNTNAGNKGYVWCFGTREEARKHRQTQAKMEHAASLSAPVRYFGCKEGT